ncbi:MAG: GGGtGRT protein, partial [Methanobrevibacter sp.]|nr:GGGtGRT protein [Methanobrevibacter sp.]
MSLFESYERRIDQIVPVLEKYGIKDLEEAKAICNEKG